MRLEEQQLTGNAYNMWGTGLEFLYTWFTHLSNLQISYIAMSIHSFNKLIRYLFIKPIFMEELWGAIYSDKHWAETNKT